MDTRISDRIKRRDVMASRVDYCDIAAEVNPIPIIESNKNIRSAIDSRYHRKCQEYPVYEHVETSESRCYCGGRKSRVNFNEEIRNEETRECLCRNRRIENEEFRLRNESRKQPSESCGSYDHFIDHRQFRSVGTTHRKHTTPEKLPVRKELYSKSMDGNDFEQNSMQSSDKNIRSKLFQDIPLKPPIKLKDTPVEDKSIQASTKTSLATGYTNKVRIICYFILKICLIPIWKKQ